MLFRRVREAGIELTPQLCKPLGKRLAGAANFALHPFFAFADESMHLLFDRANMLVSFGSQRMGFAFAAFASGIQRDF